MTDQNLTLLSVNLNAETAAALHDIMDSRSVTVTEAVRRAISVYKFLLDEVAQGRTVLTQGAPDRYILELVLP
jgi:hypothetical protein